jgi:hypothetical protein
MIALIHRACDRFAMANRKPKRSPLAAWLLRHPGVKLFSISLVTGIYTGTLSRYKAGKGQPHRDHAQLLERATAELSEGKDTLAVAAWGQVLPMWGGKIAREIARRMGK